MSHTPPGSSRRQFLKAGTLATVGGTVLSALSPSVLHAAGGDVLRVGIVGCGGRGTGAMQQALRADPNVKLVAMADAFADKIELGLNALKGQKDIADKIAVLGWPIWLCSVAVLAATILLGTRLVVAGTTIEGGTVSPSAAAAEARSAWLTVSAWLITAVLQECAKAFVHGIVPSALLG